MAEGKAGGGGAGLRTATGDKGFATKLLMQQYGGMLFVIVYTRARLEWPLFEYTLFCSASAGGTHEVT